MQKDQKETQLDTNYAKLQKTIVTHLKDDVQGPKRMQNLRDAK